MAVFKTIGIMATYPARTDVCVKSINSLSGQFTKLVIVLNEYTKIPSHFPKSDNIEYLLPNIDHKDVGKFIVPVSGYDYVFTCDDDILYPEDYVKTMLFHYETLPIEKKCLGVHGTLYDKDFDGTTSTRTVLAFHSASYFYDLVDLLGTGTTVTKTEYFPTLEYMENSQKFVDIRFAQFCFKNDIAMISVPRKKNWLSQQRVDSGIATTFSRPMLGKLREEILVFSGGHKTDMHSIQVVQDINRQNGPYGIDGLRKHLSYWWEVYAIAPIKNSRLRTRRFRRRIKEALDWK